MKVYIYTDYKTKDDNFESSRLRKNFKGLLEMQNMVYTIQNSTSFFNIAQYFTINDQTMIELFEKKKDVKNVLCLLYNEGEIESSLFVRTKEGKYQISKQALDIVNMYDYIICPSELSKHFLIKEGVLRQIFVLNPGVKFSKFNLENSSIKDIFYRIMGFNKDSLLATSLIREDDESALERIMAISKNFPNIKFIVLTKIYNKKIYNKKTKKIKKNWKNVYYLPIFEEDVYNSLIYNSDIFISVNSYFSNVIEIMESMVSNTQIFALQGSVFEDIVKDKVNGYVYNDISSLIIGIKKYLNNELPSLKEQAKEYANQFSILTYGKELIKIYESIEEVKKDD